MTSSVTQRISRLALPDEGKLTPAAEKLFAASEKRQGYVPNWLSAFALGGANIDRLNNYLFPLLEGSADSDSSLTLREREILATVVSVDNGCAYCHTLHVDALGHVLEDHWLANRIALDHREVEELSAREHALAALALVLTRDPGSIDDAAITELRDVGLSDVDIFEAVQIISIINATNRITIALGVLPDRQIFERHTSS